eukprot:4806097-Amphidinium_carterae.1
MQHELHQTTNQSYGRRTEKHPGCNQLGSNRHQHFLWACCRERMLLLASAIVLVESITVGITLASNIALLSVVVKPDHEVNVCIETCGHLEE